ncbi:LysR family transcriptional regulator [Listeria weihenstephanensis FSL R9-0317]|uniref:LysR family transcriptional regulator n=1 Tax=Listeria weihenstephanensis TaxID=1006155 RepID=A0A1S7FZ12_9LIST|nr:LysR family transcriptional regulator [Listeria weihenstephanensis]AQY52605.1 LysR family transcriptional regulator [Listeria weihenstephanensis]EUJ35373.1 LysR family transcriptional regulator [Listeria weihenstephanensis FSL R9-0317]
MKLTTLNYFVKVATESSFTKASEKLYISQPTLSRHIQELEAELGVALFIRHSHSIKLTSAGERFLTEVNDILKRVDKLSHMFDAQVSQDETNQILKVGYLSNFNMGKMYELFERFKVVHPNVQFLMKQDTPMKLAEGLADGQYDLVFNLLTYFQADDNVEKAVFMENQLQIAMPVDHALSHEKKLRFADLSQETFVLLERQQSPVIVDYVVGQGLKNGFNLKASSYVKDLDEGLSLVSVGKGSAFLYSGMNDGTLEDKYRIKIIDLERDNDDQNIVVAMNRENEASLLRALFDFIQSDLAGV